MMKLRNSLNFSGKPEPNSLGLKSFFALVFLIQTSIGLSATITSKNGGGAWSNSGTWKGNTVPGPGDIVIIGTTGIDEVLLTGNESCAGITIESGSILNAASFTLTVAGPWLNNGTFNQGTGTIAFDGVNAEINAGSGTANFNNIIIESGAILTMNTSVTVAGNFDFVLPSANNEAIIAGTNTLDIAGNLTMILPITNRRSTMTVDAGTLNLAGLLNMGAADVGNRSSNLNITTGTANLNGGISTGTSEPTVATGCKLKFTGAGGVINLQGSSSGGTPNLIPDLGTFNFIGAAAQSIWKETFYNLGVYDGTKTLAGNITVNNQAIIASGATLSTGSFNIILKGDNDPLLCPGTFESGTGTVLFNGVSNQTIPVLNYYNLTLNDTGIKTTPAASTLTVLNNLTANSELNMSGSQSANIENNVRGTGAITMGSGTISLKGDWANTGTFTKGTGTVIYNGPRQDVGALDYHNLEILGTNVKTLLGNASVSNTLTITTPASFDLGSALLDLKASGTPFQNTGTLIPSSSTVNYSSTGTTTIEAIDYYNLDASGGDRVLPSGETIGISGVFTPGDGTYTVTGSIVNFNGDLDQTIPSFTFFEVLVSGDGTKLIDSEVTVNDITIEDGSMVNLFSDGNGVLNITND
jgi:hypothetical protein